MPAFGADDPTALMQPLQKRLPKQASPMGGTGMQSSEEGGGYGGVGMQEPEQMGSPGGGAYPQPALDSYVVPARPTTLDYESDPANAMSSQLSRRRLPSDSLSLRRV
jgi:hypothetical protein